MPLYGRSISSSSSASPAAIVVGQQRSNLAKTLLKVLQESNYGNRHRQFCSHPPRSEIPLGMLKTIFSKSVYAMDARRSPTPGGTSAGSGNTESPTFPHHLDMN